MKIEPLVFAVFGAVLAVGACSGGEPKPAASGQAQTAAAASAAEDGGAGIAPARKKPEPPPDSLAVKAFDLRMKGQTKRALGMLEIGSVAGDEQNAFDLFELARVHYFMNQYEPAYRAAKQAAAIENDNARIQFWYGVLAHHFNTSQYWKENKLDAELTREAFGALEKAAALDPALHDAWFWLIKLHARLKPEDGGDREKAKALAAELSSRDPGFGLLAEGYALLPGETWQGIRDKAAALAAKEPGNLGALLALFESRLKDRLPDETIELADRIAGADPSRRYVYLNIARQFSRPETWDIGREAVGKYMELPGLLPAETAMACALMHALYDKETEQDLRKQWIMRAEKIDPDCWKAVIPPIQDVFSPPYD